MDGSFKWRINFGILLGLIILGFTGLISLRNLDNLREMGGWVDHTNTILIELRDVLILAETSEHGHLNVAPSETQNGLFKHLDHLIKVTEDNPPQQVRMRMLKEKILQFLNKEQTLGEVQALVASAEGEERALLDRRLKAVSQESEKTKLNLVLRLAVAYAVIISSAILLNRELYRRSQAESDVRRLNLRLSENLHEVKSLNRELEAFSYSVSHDLRAPLRSITGFSQILLEDYDAVLDPVGKEHLQRVINSGKSMSDLIDGLLNLARLTRRDLEAQTLNFSDLAQKVMVDVKASAEERKVEFRCQPNLEVRGDLVLLRIVLENLLSNAWKFTGKKDLGIIEFGKMDYKGKPSFFVRDNGAGFDMSYSNKLFGVFQRLHSPREFDGLGIGLATVQRIIHRHGGEVWAESEVGKGATFFFTLPDRENLEEAKNA